MTRVPSLGNGVSVPITATEIPALLETLRAEHIIASEPDMLIDWMGVRTRIPMLPWAPGDLAGTVSTALPIPDDGFAPRMSNTPHSRGPCTASRTIPCAWSK